MPTPITTGPNGLRFRGDLWNTTTAERERIAAGLMAERGFTVRRVGRLTTGLWMSVELTNGDTVPVTDAEANRYAWTVEAARQIPGGRR